VALLKHTRENVLIWTTLNIVEKDSEKVKMEKYLI